MSNTYSIAVIGKRGKYIHESQIVNLSIYPNDNKCICLKLKWTNHFSELWVVLIETT